MRLLGVAGSDYARKDGHVLLALDEHTKFVVQLDDIAAITDPSQHVVKGSRSSSFTKVYPLADQALHNQVSTGPKEIKRKSKRKKQPWDFTDLNEQNNDGYSRKAFKKDMKQELSATEVDQIGRVSKSDFIAGLKFAIPCIGCRKTLEVMFDSEVGTVPRSLFTGINITEEGEIVLNQNILQGANDSSRNALYNYLYVFGTRYSDTVNLVKNKRLSKRCIMHSLEVRGGLDVKKKLPSVSQAIDYDKNHFKPGTVISYLPASTMMRGSVSTVGYFGMGTIGCREELANVWWSVWNMLPYDCKQEICCLCARQLLHVLESHLQRNRFCVDCRAQVLASYSRLCPTGADDPPLVPYICSSCEEHESRSDEDEDIPVTVKSAKYTIENKYSDYTPSADASDDASDDLRPSYQSATDDGDTDARGEKTVDKDVYVNVPQNLVRKIQERRDRIIMRRDEKTGRFQRMNYSELLEDTTFIPAVSSDDDVPPESGHGSNNANSDRFYEDVYRGLQFDRYGGDAGHVHCTSQDDEIKELLTQAQNEIIHQLTSDNSSKHATTMYHGQIEVRLAVGIFLYERLHKVWYAWQSCLHITPMFVSVVLTSMRRKYEELLASKQGSALDKFEQLCLEFELDDKRRQDKATKKRGRNKRKQQKINGLKKCEPQPTVSSEKDCLDPTLSGASERIRIASSETVVPEMLDDSVRLDDVTEQPVRCDFCSDKLLRIMNDLTCSAYGTPANAASNGCDTCSEGNSDDSDIMVEMQAFKENVGDRDVIRKIIWERFEACQI